MKFTINFQAMIDVLPIMGYGMLGGLIVMGVICLILMLLYRLGKRKSDEGPTP